MLNRGFLAALLFWFCLDCVIWMAHGLALFGLEVSNLWVESLTSEVCGGLMSQGGRWRVQPKQRTELPGRVRGCEISHTTRFSPSQMERVQENGPLEQLFHSINEVDDFVSLGLFFFEDSGKAGIYFSRKVLWLSKKSDPAKKIPIWVSIMFIFSKASHP